MPRTEYQCSGCGNRTAKWLGKCPSCGEFGTLNEAAAQQRPKAGSKTKGPTSGPTRAARAVVDLRAEEHARSSTGVAEFDRVLGGGLVPGQVVLVAGEPGVGKSTLLLDVGTASHNAVAPSCTYPARSPPSRSDCGLGGSGPCTPTCSSPTRPNSNRCSRTSHRSGHRC